MLSPSRGISFDKDYVLRAIEKVAYGALTFSYAAYGDREGNYPPEIFSPYLPHSLCQAAIIHHRLWRQTSRHVYKERLDLLKSIIGNFTKRWMVACTWIDTGGLSVDNELLTRV
jgi:hypothetical protein